jgi:acetyl esterase/lipase
MGDARLEDGLAAAMASQCGAGVATVDFRNAGDDDLAATLNGCLAAGEWLIDNLGRFEVSRVILSGESSGAHLALETLLGLRSSGKAGCVIGFYSMCGAFNLDGSPGLKESTPSTLLIDGPSALVNLKRLTPSLEPGQRRGPLWADLSRLPPALLIAGSLDPICDDTRELGERWHQASGNASCIFVPEAPHGFNRMPTRLASRINAMGRAWIRERFDDGACTGDAAGYGAGDPLQRFSSHLPE